MTNPLDGVVVADFSRVLAGPVATMALADLGATVVKVERPDGGDDTRAWGPPWTAYASSYFESVNRSKLSLTLDLNEPADLQLARTLTERADVVVENFRTGTMQRFGLDYHSVEARNPGVVYCSITGFGSGAGADLPGYDFVVQAVGGLMSITGDPHGEPQKVGVALVDVLTGKDATIAILAALHQRGADGRGQHVEVNLLSSLLGALVNQASSYLATGSSPGRMGNQHPSIAPYELLRCRDGYLAVACGNDRQFRRLCVVLAAPGLADDPRYATNADRVRHRAELAADLESRLDEADGAHWEVVLLDAGVAAAQVGDIESAFGHAEKLGLDPTFSVSPEHPRQVASPLRLSRQAPRPASPPPRLGQHNNEIKEWLRRPTAQPVPQPRVNPRVN